MNVFLFVLQYLRIRLRDLIIKRESDKIYIFLTVMLYALIILIALKCPI